MYGFYESGIHHHREERDLTSGGGPSCLGLRLLLLAMRLSPFRGGLAPTPAEGILTPRVRVNQVW